MVFAPGTLPVHAFLAHHDAEVRPHDHEFVEIVLVQSGSAVHRMPGGAIPLRRGDVVALRPGVWHGYEQVRKLAIWNCCFGPELLQRELAWTLEDAVLGPVLWGPRDRTGGAICFSLEPAGVRLCQQRLEDLHVLARRRAGGRAAAIGRLLIYLDALARHTRKGGALPSRDFPPRVVQTIRLLEGDLARPWSMDELAERNGVDPAYLTRQFTRALGTAPIAYLARRRAERAAVLLLQTRQSIGHIAAAVGWEDPVYFARRFRGHYGMTASAYRSRFGA